MTPRSRGRPPVPASVPAATRGRIAAHPRSLSGRGAAASAAVAHATVEHVGAGHAAAGRLGPAPGGAAVAVIEAFGAVAEGV